MSWSVELYTFSKPKNSTRIPTGSGTSSDCVSNADFNIITPRIPLKLGASANPSAYNYMKISEFNRYYWIERWAFEAGLWTAYCTVDPLASWKSAIGDLSAYVLRSAAASDETIPDEFYPTKCPTVTRTPIATPWTSSTGFYVLGLIGKNSGTVYYAMSQTEYDTFLLTIFGDTFYNSATGGNLLKAEFNPIQYVTSVMWFPLSMPATTSSGNIFLGYADTGIVGKVLTYKAGTITKNITLPDHPQTWTRGAYVLWAPYTTHTLVAMPFGTISIPSQYIPIVVTSLGPSGNSIELQIVVDYITGDGFLKLCSYDSNGVVSGVFNISQSRIGVPTQLSQVMTSTLGMLSSAVGAVVSGAAGNITGAVSGIKSFVGNMMPTVNTFGMNGGYAALYGSDWEITSVFTELVDEDLADRGRPLCQVRQLSTLSGYQLCADVEVALPATQEEIGMIKGYLESGYYYE